MPPLTTSPQRTYRYVRLSIIGAVVLLAASLVVVTVTIGPIASISHTVYTPGRSVFVGVLFAVTLALVTLSGHSLEQALLDMAALCAPLIAIVPTPLRTGDVPGLTVECPDPVQPCVPAAQLPGIQNAMISLAVLAALAIITAVILARVQRTLTPAVGVAIGAAAALVAATTAWWLGAPASFVAFGHLAATSAFFGIIAIVATIAAVHSTARWRVYYAVIAIVIAVDLVFVIAVVVLRLNGIDLVRSTGAPLISIGETIAVALFAAFWTLQTVQLWNDPDPALSVRSARRRATG